ncbi:ABC transporter substrate-binding protein [Martelella radicis]|uniref:Raffinose/stachyose/melibiose transport system substrate-binding protein n=1 Tax=Martelella radicis TaxID=1397476 RepID=A0A7W6KIK8_9HYPH|nr:extracellular solute-binding protein [Martelella radicis]MBB4120608.1 raffinose/stachyose/melibiose transport system substrate-binding protein [Martelella radicis]
MGTLHKLALTTAISTLMASAAYAAETEINMLSITVNPNVRAYFEEIEKAFEASNPGVDVVISYQDDESFKTRLPTLLQSSSRPDIFYSWGGGVFREQARAGVLEDIGAMASEECKATFSQAGLGAFSAEGVLHGLPEYASEVVVWYNKDLAAEAGIDAEGIATWQQFLDAVETAKKAGVTPIVAGGKDKWPLQMYYGLLALRMAGGEAIAAAGEGEDGGFSNPVFVDVGNKFLELVALEPFQTGFMDASYDQATGLFGDGKGLFHVMGNWDYGSSKAASTSGEGLSNEQLGVISFPMVEGGGGDPAETLGGINGWLVTKGASQEAVDFLCFAMNKENQTKAGAEGYWIPVAKGASEAISNPYFAKISEDLSASPYHQLFLDQAFGASVGGTINDAAADLASGATDPEEAAARIEEARMFQ